MGSAFKIEYLTGLKIKTFEEKMKSFFGPKEIQF